MYTIYGLIDPRTMMIRYIGLTQNHPAVRLQSHLKKIDKDGNQSKAMWLKGLLSLGLSPNVVALDFSGDLSEATHKERKWIEQGTLLGWDLLNNAYVGGGRKVLMKMDLESGEKDVSPSRSEKYGIPFLNSARPPSDEERQRLREMYAILGSKGKVYRAAWGYKNGKTHQWLEEALSEAEGD